jgi:hypothetical protein
MKWQGAVILIAAVLSCSTGTVTGKDNYEFWSQFGATVELNEKWELEFEQELKFGDDASRLYSQNADSGIVYKGLASWLDVGLNFLREYETDDEGVWHPENRPHLNIKANTPISGCDISNRARFDYRGLETEPDYWRYRHMLKVKFPGKYTSLKLQPYVAEEPFLYLNGDGFIKNRLYSGVGFTLSRRFSGALFYLCESKKSQGQWDANHIIGTNIVLHLQ